MINDKKAPEEKITPEEVYGDLSLLVFSIVCAFIYAILINNQVVSAPSLRVYIAFGFFSLFFIMFFVLIGKLSAYYVIKTYGWFRKRWDKYKWFYWIFLLLLALVILFIIGYNKLSKELFWSIIVSVVAASLLGSIGWIIAYKIWGKKTPKRR